MCELHEIIFCLQHFTLTSLFTSKLTSALTRDGGGGCSSPSDTSPRHSHLNPSNMHHDHDDDDADEGFLFDIGRPMSIGFESNTK